MKHVARSICLGAFCAGTVLAEYEILLRLGGVFVVLATAFALAAVSRALYRAPEADERANGFFSPHPAVSTANAARLDVKNQLGKCPPPDSDPFNVRRFLRKTVRIV